MKKFILIAVVLAGCESKNTHWKLQTPVHINSKHQEDFVQLLPDSVRGKTTKGLLFDGDVETYLKVDGIFVSIQTVDKSGNKIDSISVIDGFDVDDAISDVVINADKTFIKIDTVVSFISDENGNVDENVRMASTSNSKYRITDGGKIEKVDE